MNNSTLIIWKANLTNIKSTLDHKRHILSDSEKTRETSFSFERDRCIFRCSRILLRLILSNYLVISPEKIIISIGPYGKPYIEKLKDKKIYFNLSHSHDWVVIGINNMSEIGVDIEKKLPLKEFPIDLSMSDFEKRTYIKKNLYDRNKYFYEIWTAKEAYFKMLGTGINDLLSISTYNANSLIVPGHASNPHIIRNFLVSENYVGAYAILNPEIQPQFLTWGVDEFSE